MDEDLGKEPYPVGENNIAFTNAVGRRARGVVVLDGLGGQAVLPTISKDIEGGGKVSVGTTAVEIMFTGIPQCIIITADKDNSGTLYVGKSNVDLSGNNAIAPLERGDSLSIDYDDTTNAYYIVASIASQNFWKGALL